MSKQDNTLEVWLDDDLGPLCLVGTLAHDRGQIRFHYERDRLKDPRAFALDPDLSLDEHPFFPKQELGNFGIFLDSSPDRWGQTLMKRREALQAKGEKRPPRPLYAWDFLIGVQDQTRQGAFSPARQVVEEVAAAVDGWQDAARRTGISGADIDLTAGAFSAHAEFRAQ